MFTNVHPQFVLLSLTLVHGILNNGLNKKVIRKTWSQGAAVRDTDNGSVAGNGE